MIAKEDAILEITKVFSQHNKTVYAVGGYVRNKLLGIPDGVDKDIDICSAVKTEELIKMFDGTVFKVEDKSDGIGVCLISCEDFECEHATFRTETYANSGEHKPNNVIFTDDITEDAKRRDFTCNAVYMDLQTQMIYDPFNGIGDIKNKIFRDEKPDMVINFAAESHVDRSIEDPEVFLRTNIIGTEVLMDASLKYGVKRYHQVSTDEVYGDLPLDTALSLYKEGTQIVEAAQKRLAEAELSIKKVSANKDGSIEITDSTDTEAGLDD